MLVNAEIYSIEELDKQSPLSPNRTFLNNGEHITVTSEGETFRLQKHITNHLGPKYIYLLDKRFRSYTFYFHDVNGEDHLLGSVTLPSEPANINPIPRVTQSLGPDETVEITWSSLGKPEYYNNLYSYYCYDYLDFVGTGFINKGEGIYEYQNISQINFYTGDLIVEDIENHPNYTCNATVSIQAVNEINVSNLFYDGIIQAIQKRNLNFVITEK